jgi:hypothetical protein
MRARPDLSGSVWEIDIGLAHVVIKRTRAGSWIRFEEEFRLMEDEFTAWIKDKALFTGPTPLMLLDSVKRLLQ